MSSFEHYDLSLLNPSFDSPLVDILTELQTLKSLELQGTTPAPLFFHLKKIFHIMESVGSARIEGNHTTLTDYIESKIDGAVQNKESFQEINNIEQAMEYIDETLIPRSNVSEHLIRELHTLTVRGLDPSHEGSIEPGKYRSSQVYISKSSHIPPDALKVDAYMRELVDFINRDDPPKYDLMKVALAHHRFGWIHPFSNGNGRVVRLLTYALLIKYGFNVQAGERVLNPTAIFCNDRDHYYEMLSEADKGTSEGLEKWCVYVLSGIKYELEKVDKLTKYSYLKEKIMLPAVGVLEHRKIITQRESLALKKVLDVMEFKASDLKDVFKTDTDAQRTYLIKKLIDDKFIYPLNEGGRRYSICLQNQHLIRQIVRRLIEEGFVNEQL